MFDYRQLLWDLESELFKEINDKLDVEDPNYWLKVGRRSGLFRAVFIIGELERSGKYGDLDRIAE